MIRKIAAVVAGLFVLGVVVLTLQLIGTALHPMPQDLDPFDPAMRDELSRHLASMPLASWALAFMSEILGAFLGGLTAGKIAGGPKAQWFAGGIVLASLIGSLFNWTQFSHPLWFMGGQLVAYPLVFVALKRMVGEGGAASPSA